MQSACVQNETVVEHSPVEDIEAASETLLNNTSPNGQARQENDSSCVLAKLFWLKSSGFLRLGQTETAWKTGGQDATSGASHDSTNGDEGS